VNAVFNLAEIPTSPYLIGGVGIYNSKFSNLDSETAMGLNLGGGLRFPVGDLTTFFEVRYHLMLGDREVGANLQFIRSPSASSSDAPLTDRAAGRGASARRASDRRATRASDTGHAAPSALRSTSCARTRRGRV
jgi:hypothetical protein